MVVEHTTIKRGGDDDPGPLPCARREEMRSAAVDGDGD